MIKDGIGALFDVEVAIFVFSRLYDLVYLETHCVCWEILADVDVVKIVDNADVIFCTDGLPAIYDFLGS